MPGNARYGVDQYVDTDRYRLHYVDVGQGHPVLMVPGSYSTYRAWDRLVARLCDRYRLLPVDYVGAGDSDKPQRGFRYTVEEQTNVLAQMIVKLGIAPTYVIGSSYGGVIAFSLAMRYPELVDRVVSIEGAVVKPKKLPGGEMAAMFKYPIIGDFFIGIARLGLLNRIAMRLIAGEWYPHMTEQDKREMLEQLTENARSATRVAWYLIDAAVQNSRDLEEEAKGITAPVLYLYGKASHDFMPMIQVNLPFFERYMPTVQVVAVPDAIHDMAFQKPDEVATLVRAFLEEGNIDK